MNTENIGYIICESQAEAYPAKVLPQVLNGKTIAEGILQTANEKNRNGRFYDKQDLFPQLEAPRTVELLKAGYLRAEMGHPLDNSLQRQSTIDDTKTCARFLELWTEGNDVWGRFVGTNNVNGHAFDQDLKEGCWPAWSLRALGSIQNTGRGAEVKNLRLITYDQVIFPSHPGAYTQRIVSEAVEESPKNYDSNVAKIVTESVDPDSLSRLAESEVTPIMTEDVISFIQADSANLKLLKEYFDFAYTNIIVNENGTKVVLTTSDNNIMVVNLEHHIHNELMKYAEDFKEEYM